MNHSLPYIKIEIGNKPIFSVIWMHGLGADGNDFVPIVHELTLLPETSIRFIFPHAPERPVSINNGYVMRAWYDIFDPNLGLSEDEEGIRQSQQVIETVIEQEVQRGIPSQNIILAGFSQGGVMALQVGLRYKNEIAGIMALSCYLSLSQTLVDEISVANRLAPIFMAHGSNDMVIPIIKAKTSKEKLLASNCNVEWHEYDMAHSVCGDEISDISHWLNRIIKVNLKHKSNNN